MDSVFLRGYGLKFLRVFGFIVMLTLTLFFLPSVSTVSSQSDGLNLETEQNWDTYGVGGTCVYGTQNIFVGDVDGDSLSEIMTGGFAYHTQNGTRTVSEAPLKVWSWNGQNVTLKASTTWNGTIYCLYAADVDKDGTVDILCGGSFRNDTGSSTSSLRVLNLNHGKFVLKAHYEGISVRSLFVSDVDKNGISELLTVGRSVDGSPRLSIWHIKGSELELVERLPLVDAEVTVASSIYCSDLDNDGTVDIIVVGYSDSLANSKGLVSVWQFNGQELFLKDVKTWQLTDGTAKTISGGIQGNTAVNNVKVADLDGDGNMEVVTAGFAYDGANVNAQIKVWRFDEGNLIELASEEWTTDYMTEAKSIVLNDVNGDGREEIVQSGVTAAESSFNDPDSVHDRAQLGVWGFNGTGLVLIESKDWTFDEGACAWNVGTGDVDNDGIVEIITVGCTALMGNCDPDMRIWSLPATLNSYPSNLPYAIGAVLVSACAASLAYLYFRRSKSEVHVN